MLDLLLKEEFIVIITMTLTAYFLLLNNPKRLQNISYDTNGNNCPNAAWYSLIIFLVGTGLYLLLNTFKCNKK